MLIDVSFTSMNGQQKSNWEHDLENRLDLLLQGDRLTTIWFTRQEIEVCNTFSGAYYAFVFPCHRYMENFVHTCEQWRNHVD